MAASRIRRWRPALTPLVLLGFLATLGSSLPAAVPDPSTAPVATVDGATITLGQVEDALLKKEGADGLTDWVQSHLAKLDWTKIKDSDVILAIGGISLTRKDLVLRILKPTASSSGFG